MNQRHDILPSGEIAKNIRDYITAWRYMARRLERVFVGMRCYAFDPGFALTRDQPYRSLELDMVAAQAIITLLDRAEKTEAQALGVVYICAVCGAPVNTNVDSL